MAKAKSIIVGDFQFPTAESAKAFYSAIRDRYKDGERLNQEDHNAILDLLALHPESSDKIGCGVSFFTVETDKKFRKTRHFTIYRVDGNATDFSFPTCIDGRSTRKDVFEALRRAIAPQIIAFRDGFFSLHQNATTCPMTGNPITRGSYHVDHESPHLFCTLVNAWFALNDLSVNDIKITPSCDNQIIAEMVLPTQKESWVRYHRENAVLRMLSPTANLSHKKS